MISGFPRPQIIKIIIIKIKNVEIILLIILFKFSGRRLRILKPIMNKTAAANNKRSEEPKRCKANLCPKIITK